jgi:hypothetical protein
VGGISLTLTQWRPSDDARHKAAIDFPEHEAPPGSAPFAAPPTSLTMASSTRSCSDSKLDSTGNDPASSTSPHVQVYYQQQSGAGAALTGDALHIEKIATTEQQGRRLVEEHVLGGDGKERRRRRRWRIGVR